MGKGDKKTKRGKIIIGSFGKTRPHKKKPVAVQTKPKKPADDKATAKPAAKAKPAETQTSKKASSTRPPAAEKS